MSIIINGTTGIFGAPNLADKNYVDDVDATKAPLESPAFTGSPTVNGNDIVTLSNPALTGAVTDNAIVRFNGTTGQVQNSSVTIDDAGNLGIGVTPSAWRSSSRTLDISNIGSLNGIDNNALRLNYNSYINSSSQWIYKTSMGASMYEQYNGTHTWFTAPSGTAGNPITWTTAMTLANNGNLLVGTTTDNGVDKLQVNGSANITGAIKSFTVSANVQNNVATTVYGSSATGGEARVYIVTSCITVDNNINWLSVGILTHSYNGMIYTSIKNSNLTISVSGYNLQATHSLGSTYNITCSFTKLF